ncbi:MAG: DUF3795 domain-containing protein [Candidatus Bathyarchaeota archaeon]|nr:DUF3795 domain-containing protein [Candidatus Bathyarchaeota archaeon]
MNTPENVELVAPCGMNCALCSSYLAAKTDVKSKGVKIPYCIGCRPRGKTCAFLKKRCQKLLNGEVNFCFECASFPCDNLKALDRGYRKRYRMSMIDNLKFIKESGMESFLASQRQVWKCDKCDGLICCHNGLCFNCDLEKLKEKKQKYRWDNQQ